MHTRGRIVRSSPIDPSGQSPSSVSNEMATPAAVSDVEMTERADAMLSLDAALTMFVTNHYDRLLRLARLVCRDAVDAGDAVQVGLEQAWRQRSSLRDEASLRAWLDRIVVREAIRIGKRRQSWLGRVFTPSATVTWIKPSDERASRATEWTAMRIAFQRLSADQRAVVALHIYAGYSLAETAGLVSAPIETVRSRLRLAEDRLRRDLEETRCWACSRTIHSTGA
jgi:RNA polymerase sigma-70 factor, ECF subfamily